LFELDDLRVNACVMEQRLGTLGGGVLGGLHPNIVTEKGYAIATIAALRGPSCRE
jgi:outer membrane lipoprotein SlyB